MDAILEHDVALLLENGTAVQLKQVDFHVVCGIGDLGRVMKVGITVWGKRISPVFDAARTLVIVELARDLPVNLWHFQLTPGRTDEVVHLLHQFGVQVLICGAISKEPAERLEQGGIRLLPFLTGKAEQVLKWYASGRSIEDYQMPGCHGHGRGQGRGRKNQCCRAQRPGGCEQEQLMEVTSCLDSMVQDPKEKAP